jgi:hypothetical protein
MHFVFLTITFIVFLSSLVQFRKTLTAPIIFGLLALFSYFIKALFLSKLNFEIGIDISLRWQAALYTLHFGFFLGALFFNVVDSVKKVQQRVALKIPMIVFLIAFLLEPTYMFFYELGLVLFGLTLVYLKKESLRLIIRTYYRYLFFFALMAVSLIIFPSSQLYLFFELIAFFFYYRIIQLTMGKSIHGII